MLGLALEEDEIEKVMREWQRRVDAAASLADRERRELIVEFGEAVACPQIQDGSLAALAKLFGPPQLPELSAEKKPLFLTGGTDLDRAERDMWEFWQKAAKAARLPNTSRYRLLKRMAEADVVAAARAHESLRFACRGKWSEAADVWGRVVEEGGATSSDELQGIELDLLCRSRSRPA